MPINQTIVFCYLVNSRTCMAKCGPRIYRTYTSIVFVRM